MSLTHDFRIVPQPSSPSPNVVQVYAASGGFLIARSSGNADQAIGGNATGIYQNFQIQTGTASFGLTGTIFGVAQGSAFFTGLGSPFAWLPTTYSGIQLAIPAYKLA